MLRIPDAPLASRWHHHSDTPSEVIWHRLRTPVAVLLLWIARSRQRQDLAELEDYQLRDIGLTRADIGPECSKPFWKK
jgi:uncharacterized protein YjiS (DUF1127 family)